ncbi:hypothetical protein [Clostridium cellulovorans]|uniref:Uncharacterized protein n=1 Tax=Clostridium cellulovorans (strain ATCC 35296 / DSM 3052 / OCM 3 / 743B) TaxID=573061 RepID=D9SPV9_CLOC7|nr:hypothetical protein [Clostridium cellulovorans]ADL52095.1 hypothetical protein Clocel_2379 [Clostridium cellulovorans 743B]
MSNHLKDQIAPEEKDTTLEFLKSVKDSIKEVSNYYREDDIPKGNLGIINIIDDINIILSGASTLFLGILDIESINPILEELVLAIESGDYTLIADLLTYEIEPIITKIEEEFID